MLGHGYMFRRESEMTPSVIRWLKNAGLQVKPEFVTPWGICDLVGLSFDADHVAHRLDLQQTKSVSSITRAALLLKVPDVEKRRSISIDRLTSAIGTAIDKETIVIEVERLIADGFIIRSSRGGLQRMNGWMPLQDRLVAVELKLHRIEEAMKQAKSNLGFVEESYVAFPMPVARRIADNPSKWSAYFDEGIGLVGVLHRRCDILIQHTASAKWDDSIQLYCVEKFWRTRTAI